MTKVRLTLTALTVLAAAAIAHAEEVKETSFDTTLNLGVTLTDGNSDTLRGNAGILVEGGKKSFGKVRAGIEGNYGETKIDGEKETDVENVRAFVNLRKTAIDPLYAYFNTSFLYDDQAAVDYRFIVGPGIGAVLFEDEATELSAEFGPSYLWERVDDISDDYFVIRIAQRLDYRISETARIWQQIEYLPRSDKSSDYILNSEIGISADVTSRVALRIVAQSAYDNSPAEDRKRHDLILISGLTVNL